MFAGKGFSAWLVDLAGAITGTLGVANGGTGAATLTDHGVLVGSGTEAVTPLSVGTNGQVLVGSTGADPVFATIVDGEGITTTLGAGTLQIDCEDATSDNKGVVELATDAETSTGSATDKVLTPSNLTGMGLLPLGTAGQVLRVNSGASALEYGTVSSTVPIGHLSGLNVSRKDNDEIYVSGGSIEVGGVLYNSGAQLTGSGGSLAETYSSTNLVIASSVSGGSGSHTAGNLSDDDLNTPSGVGAYISATPLVIDLGSNKTVGKIRFYTKDQTSDAKIEYSTNGSDYTEIGTYALTANAWKEITGEWTARYIRVTRINTAAIIMTEMQIYELINKNAVMYVYIDPPSSGTELAAENLIISATAPSFDSAKGGYYHPTNTDQRAIAQFTTDADGYVPTAFIPYLPTAFGYGDALPIVRSTIKPITKTATATLTAAEVSGTIINNYGQTNDVTLSLPTAASGMSFMVVCGTTVAKYLRIDPAGTDLIYLDGVAGTDGKYVGIASAAVGAAISFVAIQTGASAYDWVATTISGTWAAE